MKDLNKMAVEVRKAHDQWWCDIHTGQPIKRDPRELRMMIITELSEAMEGARKNLMDDKLKHRKMEEVEMADAMIRILDYCGGFGVQLDPTESIFLTKTHNKASALLDICGDVYAGSMGFASCNIVRYCKIHKLDLWGAVKEKLAFNKTRKDHKPSERRKKNGKKF